MKLIAKKGSAFEKTLKEMCETINEGNFGALDLVEKAAGVRPLCIYAMYHWGIISKMVPEFDIHPDDKIKINPHILRKKKGCESIYVPALRYKEGWKLDESFHEFARKYIVREEPLNEYGINMVDNVNGMSYYMQPAHDTDKDRYMLLCSDSTPKAFDKKKLAKDQFDIEY